MREDWIECKLEECSLVLDNLRKPINSSERQSRIANKKIEELYPYYGATGQVGYIDDYLTDGEFVLLGEDAAPFLEPTKDVAYLIQGKTWVNNHAHILSSLTNNRFLLHYLNQFNYKDYVSGTTRLKLTQGSLKSIPVKLPPLPEQRAIVKKLESLFSSLDAGVADLKKAQQQLKIYRQAVLRKAFDINAKAYKLFEICEEMFAGGDKPKDFFSEEKNSVCNVPIFANAVKDKGLYGFTKNARVTKNAITIAGRGSGTGYVEIRNEPFLPIVRLIVLVPKTKLITLKFLYFFLKNFNIEVSGSAIPQLTIPMIKDYQINIPLIKKQNEIVKQIESRLSVCDSIEQNIKESLVKAEALRQSILKKAFEGNLLTAQELAECKQAADYEPASVLLERIKAEQNKATAKPSKKKVAQPLVVAKIETQVAKISADIHAGLIAKVIKIHEENPASIDNLSHIKCEKIAHLVEYHLQIPLGRQPVKDAAGPDDYPHLKKIEHRAKMANYFAIQKKDIGYSYSSAKNSDKSIEKFQSALSVEKNKQLNDLIALFLKFDLEVSEIIATTYAGWNNLILNGNANPSDEEIVYESRENWSERKLKIARERFFKAIDWMRKNEIVPTGYGAVVPFPKKKK